MAIAIKDDALWLTFRLDGKDFCVLSDYIESIFTVERIDPIPDSTSILAGVTAYNHSFINVIEMREAFGSMNLKEYTDQFGIMKDMHASWVKDLERYVHEGGEFTKTVDPHKCKFGLWYDHFHTDNARISRLLKKIALPHERIHQCGAEIVALRQSGEQHDDEIMRIFNEAEEICQQDILPLLDRLIEIYRSANRGVILVVHEGNKHLGLLVDEVKDLVACQDTVRQDIGVLPHSKYIRDLVIFGKRLMLEVDTELMMSLCGDTVN